MSDIAPDEPPPVLVADLFPPLLESLLTLLTSLPNAGWNAPVVAPGWTVKDVALHLLGGDMGILSRGRDGFVTTDVPGEQWHELVDWLNSHNELWVVALRHLSPRLICELLQFTGERVSLHLASLDPFAIDGPVSWAGPEPAPIWLDVAREYTERWHHQQHIRDAVGRPGLKEPRFLAPVLETFVRALPYTYSNLAAREGTALTLRITGEAGGVWFVRRDLAGWKLYLGPPRQTDAEVGMDQDLAWRLFTKGVTPAEAGKAVTLLGDEALGRRALGTVSIIA